MAITTRAGKGADLSYTELDENFTDTFPEPVFLLSVDLHYQSLTKTTPLRVPPFV